MKKCQERKAVDKNLSIASRLTALELENAELKAMLATMLSSMAKHQIEVKQKIQAIHDKMGM